MENEKQWINKCREFYEKRKEKYMNPVGKILDEFTKNCWHCTLYQGGSAFANNELYELYRGYYVDPENFVQVISEEEIIKDPDFQEWYHNQSAKKKAN
ncbi:hypothetical protein GF378_01220 [Candidatus Pacearchaeota archaeon]|nr:hypothetical protein [Candidatus Pacearchaeota archaeon]